MKITQKHNIKSLLNIESNFNVPLFQRNFEWEENQVKQGLNDFYEKLDNNKKHFWGVVVSKKINNNEDYSLIDGQQRIVFFSLVLKFLLEKIKESGLDKKFNLLINKINKLLFIDDNVKTRLQFYNYDNDNKIFDKIMRSKLKDLNDFTEKKSKIFIAYKEIIRFFDDKGLSGIENQVNNFLEMEVVHIILDSNDDDDSNVFESLNSKGVKLTFVEQLKNYLFIGIKDPKSLEQKHSQYWLPLMTAIPNIEDQKYFFRDFLILKSSDTSKMAQVAIKKEYEFYSVFKFFFIKEYNQNIDIFFKDLEEFYKIWIRIFKRTFDKLSLDEQNDSKIDINRFVKDSYAYRSNSKVTTLIYLFFSYKYIKEEIKTKEFNKILNLLNNYILNWSIASGRGNLLELFSKLIIFYNNNSKDLKIDKCGLVKKYLKEEITIQQFRISDNDLLEFKFKDQVKENILRYLLNLLEKENGKEHLISVYDKNYNLEHIEDKENGKKNKKKKLEIENIGNLMILEKPINDFVNGKDYIVKKQEYKKSITYTSQIYEFKDKWNYEEIENRANILIEKIKKIIEI